MPWWPVNDDTDADSTFLVEQLGENEVGILPDTGAHDDLCGDAWAQRLAARCNAAGQPIEQRVLDQPRVVQGVGKGHQAAAYEVILTTATNDVDGNNVIGQFRAPCLRHSGVPGLMGIKTLKAKDALIRCSTGEMWFLGKGGVDIRVSPGSKHFQMKESPGGHWMLPVAAFIRQGADHRPADQGRSSASSSSASPSASWAMHRS